MCCLGSFMAVYIGLVLLAIWMHWWFVFFASTAGTFGVRKVPKEKWWPSPSWFNRQSVFQPRQRGKDFPPAFGHYWICGKMGRYGKFGWRYQLDLAPLWYKKTIYLLIYCGKGVIYSLRVLFQHLFSAERNFWDVQHRLNLLNPNLCNLAKQKL